MDQPSWTFFYMLPSLSKVGIPRCPWHSKQLAAHRCKFIKLDNFTLILCWINWWCNLANWHYFNLHPPCSVLPWWNLVDKSCELCHGLNEGSRTQVLPEEEMNDKGGATANPNSVSCVCWCACTEARTEMITPTNTCMDALTEIQCTHAPQQSTHQSQHYKQTRSLTNHLQTRSLTNHLHTKHITEFQYFSILITVRNS